MEDQEGARGRDVSTPFQLSNVKSPVNKSMSVLHYLVEILSEKDPEVAKFATENLALFTEIPKAMANFQAFFPKIVKKLWTLESEDHKCPEYEENYKSRLNVSFNIFFGV
jgi:hypothetical protein